MIDHILDLNDARLVQMRQIGGRRRVELSEIVRAFASEQLALDPDDAAADRHLAWYRTLAGDAAPNILRSGPERPATARRLTAEVEDLRRALARAGEQRDDDAALCLGRVAGAVRWYEARFAEAGRCLESAINATTGATAERARAMQELADVHFLAGDYAACGQLATDAIELATEAGDDATRGYALIALSRVGTVGSEIARTRALLEEAAGPAERVGGDLAIQWRLGLGLSAERDGDFALGRKLNEEAVTFSLDLGDAGLLATARTNLANSTISLGDFVTPEEMLREAVARAR